MRPQTYLSKIELLVFQIGYSHSLFHFLLLTPSFTSSQKILALPLIYFPRISHIQVISCQLYKIYSNMQLVHCYYLGLGHRHLLELLQLPPSYAPQNSIYTVFPHANIAFHLKEAL